jgi:hypothetical protein
MSSRLGRGKLTLKRLLENITPFAIFIGSSQAHSMKYILRNPLLCHYSSHFDRQLNDPDPRISISEFPDPGDVHLPGQLFLPDVSRPMFDPLVRWIYGVELSWTARNVHLLLELLVLGARLCVRGLEGHCVEEIMGGGGGGVGEK